LVAHHPVAQDVDAAGVGGDHAADLAAALRPDGQRKEEALRGHGLLEGLEHAARLRHAGVIVGLDGADPVQPRQAEHDVPRLVRGQRAVDEAGVAALGHDAEVEPRAGAQHGLDLRDRARAQDAERRAALDPEPVRQVGGHGLRVGQESVVPELRRQRGPCLRHRVLPCRSCRQC
jgi:hypothetical protein